MRILLQVLGLLIVLYLGWNQPYRDVVAKVCPWWDIAPSRLETLKTRAATAARLGGEPATINPPRPTSTALATPQKKR